jgi:hypothetical protein
MEYAAYLNCQVTEAIQEFAFKLYHSIVPESLANRSLGRICTTRPDATR